MGIDHNYANEVGRGVFVETYGPGCDEEEEALRDAGEEFCGEERVDIDELYQFNFITFEFESYDVARKVVATCEKRFPGGDFNTISIDDLEGENFEEWAVRRDF